MSELLLDALMRLFALLTDFEKEKQTGNARVFIQDYLERHFNVELAQKYLLLYTEYLDGYHGADFLKEESGDSDKQETNLEQIIDICGNLNIELAMEPKILLFVQLLKFLNRGGVIGIAEYDMIDVLAEQLKVDNQDYKNLKTFILSDPLHVPDSSKLLLISGDAEDKELKLKIIFNEKQQVKVWLLHVNSTDTFIFKYSGGRNLYLNGYNIQQDKVHVFASGSVIKTSLMEPLYYGRVAEMFLQTRNKTHIIYKAVDVEHRFNPKLIGVHQFSLVGRSGQLIGIIGGSGTGKSTLLNVLNGNLKLSSGNISINGYHLDKDKKHLEGVIGYVPQDDMLIEELTVFENLYYSAKLCFSKLSETKIIEQVNQAIDDFDLVEAKDLVVGSLLRKTLSGGQRKRLNIALELIRQPSILFVDEPTSGLSSLDSEKVLSLLKRQTIQGRLVIINIHQPSSDLYKLFDKLLIIDKGGRVVHNGNPMDAIVYFKRMANFVNPEERECQTCGSVKTEQPLRIIEARKVTPEGRLIRERKITPQAWYKFYQQNFEEKFKWKATIFKDKKQELPPNMFSIPSRKKQIKIYFLRDSMSKLKDKQYMLISFIEAPILALILGFFTKYVVNSRVGEGYLFSENVNLSAYMFMCVVVALFMGLNVSAEEIVKDRRLLKRESFLNLSRFSYLSAKIIVLLIISAIQTLSFVIVGNAILEIQGMTFSYWLILFTLASFSNMLGLNISSGLNSVVSIYVSIPLILIPQMLFSGVIVEFDKLHSSISNQEYVPFIGDVMASRWGFEALAVNQFKNNRYEAYFFDIERQMSDVSYCSRLLLPELKMRNNEVMYALSHGDTLSAQSNLYILNTMLDIKKDNLSVDLLQTHMYDVGLSKYSKNLHNIINQRIDSVISEKYNQYNILNAKKDKVYNKLLDKYGSSKELLAFKQGYYSKSLANMVLAKQQTNQILLLNNRYIRKNQPIFQEPSNRWGRSQFFTPYKKLGNMTVSTPVFNMVLVWLMTLLLFFTLYFQVMHRVIKYFERFRLRKLYKQLQKLGI